MTTADDYIDRVLAMLPRATPMREQIAAELRDHIGEGVSQGKSIEQVLRQLGEPSQLAESYLAAVPLQPAPFAARLMAKLVDAAAVAALTASLATLAWLRPEEEVRGAVVVVAFIAGGFAWFAYTALAEHRYGHTLGKRLTGLHVVRESGAPISLGQALVRQLPLALQVFWVDALFALFTDRRQRAFELLSKTCVVQATPPERKPRA
ncbi:MAG: RDD family protein [Vicinamibacterales bacterium]|nr:RDD family protein [Vicinamibacterales bacterium]